MKPEQEYDTYPVREGEVWAVGERHRFRCGDIRDFTPGEHTLVYCDPPWGNGPLRAFHTGAGKERPEYGWDLIYRTIIAIARAPIWVESGRAQAGTLAKLWPDHRAFEITYQRKHPCLLHYLGPGTPPGALPGLLPGMNDTETPAVVLRAYPRGTVLDPCAGRGLTAVSAHFCGWRSESNELDPRRVSAALACLRQATGLTPRRIE